MKFLPFALMPLLVIGCQQTSKPVAEAVPLPGSQVAQQESSVATLDTPGALPVPAPTPGLNTVGMTTTSSGLKYRVLSSGAAGGRSPTASDTVTVHYQGSLTDGTVFDSSIARGEPTSFGVSQVISGWTEALQRMKPGDKWLLYIPSYLAYGPRAVGAKIPPNSDLIFQVELIKIGR